MIKTSIIVPVYNTAEYIGECFESIFQQTQKEIEVIAINDGSTDESLCILEDIKKAHPDMILVSQENQGLGAARNRGMELASGEFVYFIDSDDCLVADAMETCYFHAKKNDADVLVFDADVFGEGELQKYTYDKSKIVKEQNIPMEGAKYIKKYGLKKLDVSACLLYMSNQFIKENQFRFLPKIYYEDNEFFFKVIPKARLIYIPRMLYRRRIRKDSITTSKFDYRHAKDYLTMIRAINAQQHSEDVRYVVCEMMYGWLSRLLRVCKANHLLNDKEYVKEFYQTAQMIYGDNIEEIGQLRNINVLYHLNQIVDMYIPEETKRTIERKRLELWERVGQNNPLYNNKKCVGIYGTGEKTRQLFDMYGDVIKAELVFIETNVKSGEKRYRGHDVVSINALGNRKLDCIIITSARYEQEMIHKIRKKYGNHIEIRVFRSDEQLYIVDDI